MIRLIGSIRSRISRRAWASVESRLVRSFARQGEQAGLPLGLQFVESAGLQLVEEPLEIAE
jgi:hypothetical protein